jgi:hypothetical protein
MEKKRLLQLLDALTPQEKLQLIKEALCKLSLAEHRAAASGETPSDTSTLNGIKG